MSKETVQTQASLDEVPSLGFYLREPSPEGEEAIKKLQARPEAYHIFTFWSFPKGEHFVPMIGVLVDDTMVNLDTRSGLGKEIYTKFEETFR